MSGPLTTTSDTVAALLWALANALLFTWTFRLGRRWFPTDGLLTCLLHAIVLSLTVVVFAITVLGALGLLYASAVVGAVLIVAGVGLRALSGDEQPGLVRPSNERGWHLAWAALFALFVAHIGVSGLATFPTDVDSLTYHIPLIHHWLQAHSLYAPDSSHWSFPGNLEVVGLWIVCPFSGDFLLPLTTLPFAAVLALGSVELARGLGLRPLIRHTVGLAAVANFIVFRQLLDTENDVPVAAFFVACMAYGFRFLRHQRRGDLILAAASCGLLGGVKYYALGYAGIAWGVITLAAAIQVRPSAGIRTGAYGVVATAALAGYWYVRNWIVTGSPLYPMAFGPSNNALETAYPEPWRTSLLGCGREDTLRLYLVAVWDMMGPLVYLAAVAAPVTAAWLVWTGVRAAGRGRWVPGVQRVAVVVAAAGCLGLVLVTPFLVENIPGTQNQLRTCYTPARYSLCFLALATQMVAVCVGDFSGCSAARRCSLSVSIQAGIGSIQRSARASGNLAMVPVYGLVGLCVFQLVTVDRAGWLPFQTVDTFLVGGCLAEIGFLIGLASARLGGVRHVGAAAFVLGAVALTPILSARWHSEFVKFYDNHYRTTAFRRVHASGAPIRALCAVNLTEIYPFFGPRGNVRVVQPVRAGSPNQLRDYMRAEGVEVLATRSRWNQFDKVWARAPWLDPATLERWSRSSDGSGIEVLRLDPRVESFALTSLKPASR